MFRLVKFFAYTINVHDTLCGIVMTQDLCVECRQSLRFVLCESVPLHERINLVHEADVSFLIFLCLC